MKQIDVLLDRITMYRLILYYVIAILVVAVGLSFFHVLPYTPLSIIAATGVLLVVCGVTNFIFSLAFEAPSNLESTYIAALILACIVPPLQTSQDIPFLLWAGVLAMASKYILAIRKKHIFNPAAIAVVLTAFWLNQSATWWVGTIAMLPVVLIGGLLMVRKLRRYDQVYYFVLVSFVTVGIYTIVSGSDLFTGLQEFVLRSPLFFFAFVMLTEPLTSPSTKFLQGIFGGLVGFLFAPQVHFGTFYPSPELALVFGNLFAYVVSPKVKEHLVLNRQIALAPDVTELEFTPSRHFSFQPGQHMEFTLPHHLPDSRGSRRYFTVSSSPTEDTVKLGVKYYPHSSSFKRHLAELSPQQNLMAGQIAGDFILPKQQTEKLVFIAGGIGITPFRSMLKYLTDRKERRDITLMYMNKAPQDVVYRDIFSEAEQVVGLKTVYTFTVSMPVDWTGPTGFIDETMVKNQVPDYTDRIFYISGPHPMVTSIEKCLRRLGVKPGRIKKDFFPGLA